MDRCLLLYVQYFVCTFRDLFRIIIFWQLLPVGDIPPPSPTPSGSNITSFDEDSEEFQKIVEEAEDAERKNYLPCDQMAYLYIMQQEPYDRMQSQSQSSSG